MKKRIRKTGVVVDVIAWYNLLGAERDENDSVSYIDSKDNERVKVEGLNLAWDFEDVEEVLSVDIDWEQRRYDIVKSCINGILGNDEMVDLANDVGLKNNCRDIPTNVAEMAVAFADALIAKLKEGGEK